MNDAERAAAAVDAAYERGRRDERADVVSFLRKEADWQENMGVTSRSGALNLAADIIKYADHLKQ